MIAPVRYLAGKSRWRHLPRKKGTNLKAANTQLGVALLALLGLLALIGVSLFINQLNSRQFDLARLTEEEYQLATAKQALIGDAISLANLMDDNVGRLRVPDIGVDIGGAPSEGNAGANNNLLLSIIGKFPWRTLATSPLRDRHTECLWLVTSGRFKRTAAPPPSPINWDTLGQIDVVDGQNNLIATNLAALLIAPGPSLDGQNRALGDQAYRQCGGNYDARNYLDSFDNANAIGGQLNYFAGSVNNRQAPDANNKRFVLAETAHFNDRFLPVTTDDLFTPLIRRSDFAVAVRNLLDSVATQNPVPSANRGTDNIVCGVADRFCANWREMLFLTQLPAASQITIDGIATANCNRVLIFSGRKKTGLQQRTTAADRANINNYLEAPNADSFNAPVAINNNFSGASQFNWRNPGADILRCLP